jgi:hypothetical protein
MKLLSVLAIALVACTDVTAAWSVTVYSKPHYKGSHSTKSGNGGTGSACHKISGFKGPNLSGKVTSFKYTSFNKKHKSVCAIKFYESSNCKGSYGDGFDGYGQYLMDGSSPSRYYSIRTTCKRTNLKRSGIEGGEDFNATASALEDINLADSQDWEYEEESDDLDDLEDPEEWDVEDVADTDDEETVEE